MTSVNLIKFLSLGLLFKSSNHLTFDESKSQDKIPVIGNELM